MTWVDLDLDFFDDKVRYWKMLVKCNFQMEGFEGFSIEIGINNNLNEYIKIREYKSHWNLYIQ